MQREIQGETGDAIHAMERSADGRYLVIGTAGGALRMWDLETGDLRLDVPEAAARGILALAVDGSGSILGACGDGLVRRWSAESGALLSTHPGHVGEAIAVAVGPGGRAASGGDDGTIRIWSPAAPDETLTIDLEDPVYAVAISADGRRVIAGTRMGWVDVRDATTGERVVGWQAHEASVRALRVAPDGRTIVTGSGDRTGAVWDLQSGERLNHLVAHAELLHDVDFGADGTIVVTGAWDRVARLWDARPTSKDVLTLHTDTVDAVAFSPDGARLASASRDGTVRLWDAKTFEPLQRFTTSAGSCGPSRSRPTARGSRTR